MVDSRVPKTSPFFKDKVQKRRVVHIRLSKKNRDDDFVNWHAETLNLSWAMVVVISFPELEVFNIILCSISMAVQQILSTNVVPSWDFCTLPLFLIFYLVGSWNFLYLVKHQPSYRNVSCYYIVALILLLFVILCFAIILDGFELRTFSVFSKISWTWEYAKNAWI